MPVTPFLFAWLASAAAPCQKRAVKLRYGSVAFKRYGIVAFESTLMAEKKTERDDAEPADRADVNTRVRRNKEAVLTVTLRLMFEEGIGGVSVDEDARRSGVAKTTIYRHWPSRSALLVDAC